ncbi:MAG TPA: amidohydrolase [Methanolinea sp.]|nr:amidohydrolase [Methanolinea sp.]
MAVSAGWKIFFGIIAIGLCILAAYSIFFAVPHDRVVIVMNGTIYTDPDHPVQNLLIRNGIVQATNVNPAAYRGAEILDLHGFVAYPGFHDSHVHLLEAGYGFSSNCSLYGATDAKSIAAIVGPIAASLPPGEPMIGGGFSLDDYDAWSLADLAQIDAVTGDHPVFLGDQLGHNAIVNTAALKVCNITGTTQPPPGGIIILENGKPTGMLRESAMVPAGNVLFGTFPDAVIGPVTERYLHYWASFGYTSINDLMGSSAGRMFNPELFKKMEREGNLPLRVHYFYTLSSLDEIDDALPYRGNDTDMVRFAGLKIFVDGAFAGGQANTSWKNAKGNYGLTYVYTDDSHGESYNINRIVAKADNLGLNVHYHVQGDQAINAVLTALENQSARNGGLKSNHTLIHLAYVTDEQIARMKKLRNHVSLTVQPAFWDIQENLSRYYGDHTSEAYPFKKLFSSGIPIGISTDFYVSPLSLSPPTAIAGIASQGGNDPRNHTPLTIQQVIRGLTTGSAATTPSRDIGKLEPGYKADIVIFDQDPNAVPPGQFTRNNPKVLATYINGINVYRADGWAGP